MTEFICRSFAETYEVGASFGRQVTSNAVLLFNGELGAGKTAFIKGFVSSILEGCGVEVTSPTFTYLNIYQGLNRDQKSVTVYHFDLYRLRDLDEFLSMGFDEFFEAGGVCCVEWAEKIASLNIPHATHINIKYLGNEIRCIEILTHLRV